MEDKKAVEMLQGLYEGKTAHIVGKGPSLKYLRAEHFGDGPKREEMYRLEYARIVERIPLGGRVLDVGCGNGGFLSIFDDRWEKYGLDPSEFAHAKAASKGIEMVSTMNVIEQGYMDIVVFRGTLQHINFPMQALVQATRVLKRGGMLVILATPNADSLTYSIWKNLPALDPTRNWIVFGHHFLLNILKRLGFGETEIIFPYLDTPYANPLMDIWKFSVSLFFGYRKFAFPGNMMEIYARKL